MPQLPLSEDSRLSLEAEVEALRNEVRALRAERLVAANLAGVAERYRLSQARFRAVFEHSPLGQKIIGADMRLRQANAAVAALLGVATADELLGRPILDFAHPDDRGHWAQLQAALWQHRRPWFVLETRLLRPDGAVVWCRVTSVLFPDEAGELGYTTLEDITERRDLETRDAQRTQQVRDANEELTAFNEELHVANEELQEANLALGRTNAELDTFVYAASHDLRTPATNLQGLLEALEEQLPAEARQAEQVAPVLEMMRTTLRRFRHALDRLAYFGDVRHNPAGPREKVMLAAVLNEVRQDVAPLLAASGGRLEVDLAGNPSAWFAARHVHSVLLNLVSNGLKYRHPDRPPVVRVQGHGNGRRLVVRVQDNGLGLSETQQGQLFRLFRRLHTHVEGTGVGLYLVKKILDNAGGSIHVESQPGQGTTFIAVFPA